LYYLGVLIPEFKDARRWRSLGKEILVEQLPVHVRPDGVYFEQSSYYHRYTTDFYIHFLTLAKLNGDDIADVVSPYLVKMLDHLMYITRPDGSSPLFGDDDGGRLMMLEEKASNDFRAALSTGAALFSRPDYKFVAGVLSEETLWLLGSRGVDSFDQLEGTSPPNDSRAFESGGYYVMRDGWEEKSNYLLVDCGPHGQSNCGHAHADALAIEVATQGNNVLVDPGTYTYTGSKEGRDWFRGSKAHSTLMIDDQSSSIPAGPFSWQTIAQCDTHAWNSSARFDYFSGSHGGYGLAAKPVNHVRSILFIKHNYWIICDEVTTSHDTKVNLRYNFEGGEEPNIEDGTAVSNSLSIGVVGESGKWEIENSWVSHCYGERLSSKAAVFSVDLKPGTTRLISFLIPRNGRELPRIREVEAVGGLAFEIIQPDLRDLVLINATNRIETVTLKSDFAWIWARLGTNPGALPEELVLINGRSLEQAGRQIVNQDKPLSAWARSTGDKLELHVDEIANVLVRA